MPSLANAGLFWLFLIFPIVVPPVPLSNGQIFFGSSSFYFLPNQGKSDTCSWKRERGCDLVQNRNWI